MVEEKHIIKKAVLEVYLSKADGAFDAQNKALNFFKEKMLPLIEKIIDKFSVANETIRIDKLELDFNNFNHLHSNDDALRKFEQHVEEKLIQLIAEKSDNFSGETIAAIKKIPKEKADEELFIHLLKTGTLPWWAKTEEPISLELLAQKILQQSSDSIKRDLIAVLAIHAVRKRIAYKLSTDSVEKIIALVCIASDELIKFISEILNFVKDNIPLSENIRQELYEHALKYRAISGISMRLFLADFIKEKNDLRFAEKIYSASKTTTLNATALTIKNALADTNTNFEGKIKKMFDVKDMKIFFSSDEKQKAEKKKLIKEGYFEPSDLIEFTGDYFVKNAGVIILTPYLPMFLKELGLTDGKLFISDEAAERAVYLLQYLSSGNEENREEHEMVLNKILCGVEITKPLILQFFISEKEKEECSNLLQAVANNWQALKGTSGEGMRDAFFKRDGLLEQQSNGWNLKIEKTTIDILLDKLPWGISIIQMPWSMEMIFVNWVF
jgi:hypothetical protein